MMIIKEAKARIGYKGFTIAVVSALLCVGIFLGETSFVKAASDCSLSPQTKRELAVARQGTARYHNINNAIADGYIDINLCVPQMGCHYLKPANLDADFDQAKPEILVYADFGNGHQRLVAVEYAVPTALSATPPEGFTGDDDVWDRNETFGLWTLHAWIWYPNQDGMFTDFNPRVP